MKFIMMILGCIAAGVAGATVVLQGDGANAGGIGTGVTIPACSRFTIEAWVYAESTSGENVVLAQHKDGTAGRSSLQIYNGKVGFFNGGGNGWTTGETTVPANEWHHIAVVHDTDVGTTVYLDGIADGTNTTKPVALAQTKAVIGNLFAYATGRNDFKGCLSEIRVWTNALSAADIQSRMHARVRGMEPGLFACWPLEDVAFDSTPEIVGNVRASLNSHFSSAESRGGLALAPALPRIVDGTTLKGYNANLTGIRTPLATVGETFTFEAWVNPYNSSGQRWLLSQFPGTGRVNVQLHGGNLRLFQGDCTPNDIEALQVVPSETWSHVAATRTPTNVCLYLNGVCVTNVAVTKCVTPVTEGVWIGVPTGATIGADTYTFAGFMQEVRIWSIARTADEINADIGAALTGREPGLAALYPMSECTGPTVRDLVSGADVAYNSEKFGWNATPYSRVALARRADGEHDAVIFPPQMRKCVYDAEGTSDDQRVIDAFGYADTGVKLANADFTLEAWVNPLPQETASGEERHIVGQYKASTVGRMSFFLKNGHLEGCLNGTGFADVIGKAFVPSECWTHVAYVHEGTKRRLYLNGVLDAEVDDGTVLPPTDQATLQIGAQDGSRGPFKGRIAEVRAWSYARTAEELSQFAERRLNGREEGLVGYWRLDGDTGGVLVNSRRGGDDGRLYDTTLEPTAFELADPIKLGLMLLFR